MVDSLLKVLKKDGAGEYSLEVALDASRKAVLQGGVNVLLVSMVFYLYPYIQGYMHACMHIMPLLSFSVLFMLFHLHLIDILQDFRKLLDHDSGILVRLRELTIDLVQEGFQDFFRQLEDQFLLFSGRNNSSAFQDHGLVEGAQGDKTFAGLVLVLAQLSAFIEQTVIPKITEAR